MSRLQHADFQQWGRAHVPNTGLKSIQSVLGFQTMRTDRVLIESRLSQAVDVTVFNFFGCHSFKNVH